MEEGQEHTLEVYFIFNKHSQEMIGITFDKNVIRGDLLWRSEKVKPGEDLTQLTWVGDYSNGRMAFKTDIDQNAQVNELDLEKKFYERLFRKYKIEDMLCIILSMLSQQRTGKESIAAKELLDFYDKNLEKLQDEIEYFSKSEKHEFLSKEDLIKKAAGQFTI